MRHPSGAARRRRRGATAGALALAFPVALSVFLFNSHPTAAAAAASSPPVAPGNDPVDTRARTVACSPTSFNGTLIGEDSCLVQPGRAWLSGSAAEAVVSAPTESDCCSQCRARQPPNARSPPETACIFAYCDAGPGLYISGSCDDGLGGLMRDGECRIALVPLPIAGAPPGDPALPPASAGVVSGTPATSSLLPLRAAPPPRGYRAVGPVRLPAGAAASFDGPGCDFSTDELLRRSVSRPECVSNATSAPAAARLCSGLAGCTGVSWYPTNGIPILRAYSARGGGGFADVGNPAFGAVAAGEPVTASSSLAVFKFGALDKRCVTPSPYSFLFVQVRGGRRSRCLFFLEGEEEREMDGGKRRRTKRERKERALTPPYPHPNSFSAPTFQENAPRPPGLADSPFEAQEEAMGAARRRRVVVVATVVAAVVAAAAAAVAALVFLLLRREAKKKRRGGGKAEAGGGGGGATGGGGVEGGQGFRDEKSVGGGSEALSGLGSGLGSRGGDPSFRGGGGAPSPFASSSGAAPGGLSKQSSLERMVRGAATRTAKMRAVAEGSSENRGAGGNGDGSGPGGHGSDDDDPLEDWELPLTEIEILQRPDGTGDWLLGEGASGNVYRGRLSGLGGQDVAVKVFLDQDDGDGAAARRRHEALHREVVILKSLRDQNVVRFVGANVRRGSTVLVTEYCPRGDLYRALARDGRGGGGIGGGIGGGGVAGSVAGRRRFTWTPSYVRARGAEGREEEARRRPGTGLNWSVAADVCRGLAYLHGRGLVHLDVKSPNVLLGEGFRALVADVGLARVLRDDDEGDRVGGGEIGAGSGTSVTATAATSSAGTFAWAAPELLLGRRVSEAADIYSLGVVLWELSTGEPPPPNRRLRALEVPEEAPAEVRDCIDRCLEEEPQKRPSAREMLEFFAAGLARLDAEAGVVRNLASAGSSVGGSVGDTLARVSRATSAAPSAADDAGDAFALPPGGARGGGEAAPLRRISGAAAPRREPPVPEEGGGGEEESLAAAAR